MNFWQGNDAEPLYIRAVSFTADTSIGSSSTDPCADNTISVTVHANGPVFRTCVTTITISGLLDTATPDSTSLDIGGLAASAGLIESTASWVQSSGTIIIDLAADIITGCEDMEFQFTLENRPGSSDGIQTVSISTGDPDSPFPDASVTVGSNFLNVESVAFNIKDISSDDTDPCAVMLHLRMMLRQTSHVFLLTL